MSADRFALTLPDDLIDLIVERVVERLDERGASGDPWLTVEQSAAYIAAPDRQRIYDLRRQGKLPKTGDGRRALNRRSALDRYLEQGSA